MGGDPRVRHLLEEILDTERSPEEVCRDCAELLPQVHEGLRRLRLVEAEVGTLFPERVSTSSGGDRPAASRPPSSRGSPDMMCRPCWATVAWVLSTRLGT